MARTSVRTFTLYPAKCPLSIINSSKNGRCIFYLRCINTIYPIISAFFAVFRQNDDFRPLFSRLRRKSFYVILKAKER